MAKGRRCSDCGSEHYGFTDRCSACLEVVTPAVTHVTAPVTNIMHVTRPVTDLHNCPLCGLVHHGPKYRSNAARQRAYRERKRGD